jgi:hypothetical protein
MANTPKKRIALNDDGEYLYFDEYDDNDFATGYIITRDKKRIVVPNIASLVFRGYGWTLLEEGERLRLLPKD